MTPRIWFAILVVPCTPVFGAKNSLLSAAELVVILEASDLADAFSRQQILVDSDGRDVTRQQTFRSLTPEIARVDALGHVSPVRDGTAEFAVGRPMTEYAQY